MSYEAILKMKDGTSVVLFSGSKKSELKDKVATLRAGMKKRGFIFAKIEDGDDHSVCVEWKNVKKVEYKKVEK